MGNNPEWENKSDEAFLLAQVPGGTDWSHMMGSRAQENGQVKKALRGGSGSGLGDLRLEHTISLMK